MCCGVGQGKIWDGLVSGGGGVAEWVRGLPSGLEAWSGDQMLLPWSGSNPAPVTSLRNFGNSVASSAGSIYRSIAILVNVRYRYLMVSRYFDISNDQT